jgi:hypothetical protein
MRSTMRGKLVLSLSFPMSRRTRTRESHGESFGFLGKRPVGYISKTEEIEYECFERKTSTFCS